jgi:hypothetical protein
MSPRRSLRSRAAATVNRLWRWSCAREASAFENATRDVRDTQRALLAALVRRNEASAFGRDHAFPEIRTLDDFRHRVPIRDFDAHSPYLDRLAAGERHVLTSEPVRCLQPTSGSTRASKLVPYTASLRAEFQRAIAVWVHDLFTSYPRLADGVSYWSISPVAIAQSQTISGTRIGFEDDVEYLDIVSRALAPIALAAPSALRHIADLRTFRRATLACLIASRDLSLVSVWSPTFFSLLLDELDSSAAEVAEAVETGRVGPLGPMDPAVATALERRLRAQRGRAELLRAVVSGGIDGDGLRRLWPRLGLLSCWADANAAGPARELEGRLPWCTMQPKGLVATEGFVSIPRVGYDGAALAIRSHVFELEPAGEAGATVEPHEAEPGRVYGVIVTTGGGLYRYRLGDLVEVVGRLGSCPLVRFVGRGDRVSDWSGEKLNERHVAEAIGRLLPRPAAFCLVSCERFGPERAYVLFLDEDEHDPATVADLGGSLDAAFRENFHYAYCRDLGQLGPARVLLVPGASRRYLEARCADGARLGDVKPPLLEQTEGWLERLRITSPPR